MFDFTEFYPCSKKKKKKKKEKRKKRKKQKYKKKGKREIFFKKKNKNKKKHGDSHIQVRYRVNDLRHASVTKRRKTVNDS